MTSPQTRSPVPNELAEVRVDIDALDRQIVDLLAKREVLVRRAGRLKIDASEAPAPQRAAQVIESAVARAEVLGADPDVVRATYGAMVSAFIALEAGTIRARANG